ncbi:ATP-binding cassette domain-containing protein [Roseomonas terrae]|jgi:nickel transport system ATP-binding protein|uniref:ATP-binding cassette domain-containing protein n=1 Tax=Neoroseomonas terrae TaxID=424799 RepID=A0ABS5EB00_9PROT|nr:ATP-binding cassette domain-containing protein [Neoroseomonas terrae]MBR0648125.1 ATP-binding cassette domain-containing protein [Neoroseomonas terrae]
MTLFEMHGVFRSYRQGGVFGRVRRISVLEDAGLRIEAGECVALLGPTGSGKSTLGRLLLGIERPDAGSIWFDGQPLCDSGGRVAPSVRRAVQAVFQDPVGATSPRFTAAEVVAEPLRLPRAAARDRVAVLMADVGLEPGLMDRPAHRLSGGQLQRLCIARALASAPRLVLLDEAVSSLDVETQTQVLDLLRDLRRRAGVAYLFVTHDLRLVRHFADRCYVMQDRRPVEVADPLGKGPVPPVLAALRAAMLPAVPGLRRAPVT